jgi:hypothetical protein
MKIKRIDLRSLRNEEWFNFFSEFKKFVEEVSPDALKIEKLFAVFAGLYNMADEVIEKIRKSNLTEQIAELDKQRDSSFRGLIFTIESYKHHFDSAKRDAAESLDILTTHYGNLATKPYNEETSGIYNFLQEFRANYSSAIATLELAAWLDELERSNLAFEDAVLKRNQEEATKTELRLLDIRRETNRCYANIIERLDALMLLAEEDGKENEVCISFAKTLNANIKRYLDTIAQRKGRAGN